MVEPTEGVLAFEPVAEASRHGELRLSLRASVLDIGLAGLAIETGTRLTPQHSMCLGLQGADGTVLELAGRVVWCFFHGTVAAPGGEQEPVYRAGIEFEDVLTPVAERLLAFLEGHAQVTRETRMFGRFRVANAGPVALHSSTGFRALGFDAVAGTVRVEAGLGLEPVPGGAGALRLHDKGSELGVTVIDARRVATSGSWELDLALEDPSPVALATLRERLRI
jgi:hypothetical protein